MPEEPEHFVPEQLRINTFKALSSDMSHALQVSTLPNHHRDPFDRILIAQAKVERMPILSADPKIADYQVEVIW